MRKNRSSKGGRTESGATRDSGGIRVAELAEKMRELQPRDGTAQVVGEILTHNTIHETLLKRVGLEANDRLDNITHWNRDATRLLIGIKQKSNNSPKGGGDAETC